MSVLPVQEKEMGMRKIGFAALAALAAPTATAQEVDRSCVMAAHRVIDFLIEEAVGTRHEQQIAGSLEATGKDEMAMQIASTLPHDQCAMLVGAPDSVVRSMAIAMLPERMGN